MKSWAIYARRQSERFWSKVDRRGPDECWPWLAGTDKDGYGKFALTLPARNGRNPQRHVRAHRVAFALGKREALGRVIRHDCDTPACCNPHHLRSGTPADNRADCVARGRQPRGQDHPHAKLRSEQVVAIRSARGRETCDVLAERYGVCPSTISHIWTGRNWPREVPR